MPLIKDDKLEGILFKQIILLLEHAVAGDEKNRVLAVLLLWNIAYFFLVVKDHNFAQRLRKIFMILKRPVLH